MTSRVLALILVAASAACSADHEFDRVISAVEKHYGVRRTHIPLMGVASFFVKVAHPAGTSGLKIAIFEDLPSPTFDDQVDLDRFMDSISGGRLQPMVVTHSRRDGESTYILTGDVGKSTEMLIATFERNEATVVQVTVNIETLLKMIGSPGHAHDMFGQHHDHDRDSDDGK